MKKIDTNYKQKEKVNDMLLTVVVSSIISKREIACDSSTRANGSCC